MTETQDRLDISERVFAVAIKIVGGVAAVGVILLGIGFYKAGAFILGFSALAALAVVNATGNIQRRIEREAAEEEWRQAEFKRRLDIAQQAAVARGEG